MAQQEIVKALNKYLKESEAEHVLYQEKHNISRRLKTRYARSLYRTSVVAGLGARSR